MDEIPEWWEPYRGRFPLWHAFLSVNGLYYARRRLSSPPIVVVAKTPEELNNVVALRVRMMKR